LRALEIVFFILGDIHNTFRTLWN